MDGEALTEEDGLADCDGLKLLEALLDADPEGEIEGELDLLGDTEALELPLGDCEAL